MREAVNVGGRKSLERPRLEYVRTAQPLHFALLQEPQQLGLHSKRQIPNFVQKQCAAMRVMNASKPRLDCAGEGAAHVSEQLSFEQSLWNGGAIDHYQRIFAPVADLMDGSCNQLLASAGFADD